MNETVKKERQLLNSNWLAEGAEHIWLPYTQMKNSPSALPVVDADGCKIKLEDGRELIDGTSSWWSTCHGYKHPKIVKAIQKQAEQLSHIMFAGLAHEPAYKLAKRLCGLTGLDRAFFSDSGSTAVEVAMKMAFQYWRNKGKDKTKFISFKNGYHGDTMGAMSLADPDDWVHATFKDYAPQQICISLNVESLKDALEKNHRDVAAVIIEPLMQGAGGFKFHSTETLKKIRSLAKQYDVLFIADEVATGFGRLGKMFACEEALITPDIMCLGKALTAGYVPMAATLATKEVFDEFLSEDLDQAFMHGPTYMANPLASAAANASLDLFESEPRLEQVQKIEEQLEAELAKCGLIRNVSDIRIKGAVGALELKDCNWEQIVKMRQWFVEDRVWIRPFDNVVYIMPPFTISETELSILTNSMFKILSEK